ncbi:MAG: DUF362 domain-containing protein [Deltaproteobacteria bacterium]|nr:DUF362 domain-containing protein [Deltaproteobacteria bacterium]
MKKVSVTRCGGYGDIEVYGSIKGSLEPLGGIGSFVKRGERILIKPNLLSGKPPEAAVTTHPAVIKAIIRLVKSAGAFPVVGDSPALGGARSAAEKSGILEVCRAEGAEFAEFREAVTVECKDARTFKRIEVARDVLNADGIINVPKLKTHAQLLLTLGVKNLFGCVPGKRKAQWHLAAGVDASNFAGMMLDLHSFLNPRLTVIDGVVAMEGNGPASGTPRPLGLIIASPDAIAADTVTAHILGVRPDALPILKAASLRSIKETVLGNITIEGEKIEDVKAAGFKLPPLASVNFSAGLPYFMDRALRKALTSRPHIDASRCTLCNICVEVCPPGIMEKKERINIDYDGCIRCYCCQELCPGGAISPRDGWLKRLIPGL